MIIKFLFSSPNGDIPIEPKELLTPFKITPSENHTKKLYQIIQKFHL